MFNKYYFVCLVAVVHDFVSVCIFLNGFTLLRYASYRIFSIVNTF